MDAIDAGNEPAAWPNCLPADKRAVLRQRTGLRLKLAAFWEEFSELTPGDRTCVRNAISSQTDLPNVYSDVTANCPCMDDIPVHIQASVKALSKYLFGQLGEIKEGTKALRDIQFENCQNNGVRICPFCGLDYFQPVGTKRNALDHLMPISKYPFASADFKNLPPTCHTCNSQYKGDRDVLFDVGGRRLCADPYAGPTYQVRLEGSVFESGNEVNGYTLPRWEIDISGGPAEQANTWDAVYEIRSRFVALLDADFLSWVKSFATWFVKEVGEGKSSAEVAAELPRYIDNVIQDGLEDRAFLKAEVFRFLDRSSRSAATGEDVKEWLWSQVEYAV